MFAILGPTASGKSSLALRLAERERGEIVACDALMVYRGFDVGTNKPTQAERAAVPHHGLDVCEASEVMQAARYSELALAWVTDIERRGKVPILVVGTYLYFRALVHGLGPLPPANQTLRDEFAARESSESGWIAREVARVDPESFAEAHGANLPRLVRALEVFRLTGTPASVLRKEHGFVSRRLSPKVWVLDPPREKLSDRIELRVREMWDSGWVDEVRRLIAAGVHVDARPMQAVGYRAIAAMLRGEMSEMAAKASIAMETRQYARRQRSFFKQEREALRHPCFGEEVELG